MLKPKLAWFACCSVALQWMSPLAFAQAHARTLKDSLHVRSGAGCLTAEVLQLQVQLWLGSDHASEHLSIEVDGSPTDPRVVTFRVIEDGRVLSHRSFAPGPAQCESLQAVVGLSIALAIKASLIDELGKPLPDDPSQRTRSWAFAAGAVGAYDAVPGFAPGLDLRIEHALPPNFALRLGVFALAGFGKTFERQPGRFDTALVALRLDACVNFDIALYVSGRGCAGVLAGGLYAEGHAFVQPESSLIAWIALANSAELLLALSPRWSLDLALFTVMPLRRTAIGIRDSSGRVVEARNLTAVGGALSVGPLYHF